jgi:hypothetical protein
MQTTESLRAEEASILAELAQLNRDSDSRPQAATPTEGTQQADVVTPPQSAPIAPAPRGFGMASGQLLWGNSRAADGQVAEDMNPVGAGTGGVTRL